MAIGLLGISFPTLLLVGDAVLLRGSILGRPSLSAYYYSGMRDEFTGISFAIGMFLVFYLVSDRTLENVISSLAGAAALSVAIFPTTRPDHCLPLTPLQESLGEAFVSMIHAFSASVFFISLAFISYFFGYREGSRRSPGQKLPPGFWQALHYGCSAVLVAAMFFIVCSDIADWWQSHAMWVGEVAGLGAFGVSWLAKGANLRVIFDRA